MSLYTVTHRTEQRTVKETALAHSSMAVYMWALERYGIGAITVKPAEEA